MIRNPIRELAKLANILAKPGMERPSYWRLLLGYDHWALILVTHGKPGDLPDPPYLSRIPRMSPTWLRRTGGDLTPEQLLHERISQHLQAHAQGTTQTDLASAASIATTAAVEALAELGVDISALTRPDSPEMPGA